MKKTNNHNISTLVKQICSGSRNALARAITLVESTKAEHQCDAIELMKLANAHVKQDDITRIALTGPPGAGKSTLIETIGLHLIKKGKRIAVLAFDPSSTRDGGAILGDKTRMEDLAKHTDAFIRPSASAHANGGVNHNTNDIATLCACAKYDTIFIETVGVGQSETSISNLCDIMVLVASPTGGDSLQGIKRGITELVDMIWVNKSDGILQKAANIQMAELKHSLQLMQARAKDWKVPVITLSALQNTGIEDACILIDTFKAHQLKTQDWHHRHHKQNRITLVERASWMLTQMFKESIHETKDLHDTVEELAKSNNSSTEDSAKLIKAFLDHH